jgi:hypothetical protein
MEPIATYLETRFDGSRTFILLPDKIVVRGKQTLLSEFDTTISLSTLNPDPGTLRIRSGNAVMGGWMALVGFIGCSILVSGLHMTFAQSPPFLVGGFGFCGLLLMANTWSKVEFVRFKNDVGVVVLDVARAGKQAAQLDSFIDLLSKQIRIARGAT